MNHIKLKSLINEHNRNPLYESFNKDLEYLQEKLIEEGLWDAIKQKAGGVIDKTSNKAKELLLKPLLKVIVDKIKKDDPDGFAKLQQAAQDPQKIEKLINHPEIQKQKSKVEKELQSTKEGLTEQEEDDFLQEYFDAVLEEAKVLRDDPRNVSRRQRYAKRKVDRLVGKNQPTKKQEPIQEPSAGDNIKQGVKQLGKGLAKGADKLGVAAIEKTGDTIKAVGKGVGAAMDTKAGQAVKGAVGGLVSKVYGWAKSHPKITAAAGIGLMVAVLGAAAVGSGGIVPLMASTLGAAGTGALKGGAVGAAIGAAKDAYGQIKGGATSFKDLNYKQLGKAALKTGGKGAAIGAAVGAGANVLGKAALGARDIASGEYGKALRSGDGFTQDMTPGEKRNLGLNPDGSLPVSKMSNKQWAAQYNPNDINTWKIKPAINSTQGYITASKENELLLKAIKLGKVK
jgi:hypothetical protein